jgi:hypothetical protein
MESTNQVPMDLGSRGRDLADVHTEQHDEYEAPTAPTHSPVAPGDLEPAAACAKAPFPDSGAYGGSLATNSNGQRRERRVRNGPHCDCA